jgi:hypothetical protein
VWKLRFSTAGLALTSRRRANTPARFVPPFTQIFPDDPTGPDELMDPMPELWPATDVVPFHYPHPVTGKMWKP